MSIRTTIHSSQRALAIRIAALCLALVSAGTLTGCGGFWQAITTTTTTNTGTGYDIVYVGKAGINEFAGYAVGAGSLTAVTGSPYSISSPPLSMAVTPGNTYLYVGTANGIYGYSIAAGGGLTVLNSGTAVAQTPNSILSGNPPISMDVSPDGNWLVALSTNNGGAALIYVYQIAQGTGLITYQNTGTISLNNSPLATVHTIKISPNQDLVAASLGTAGTVIVSFNALQTNSSLNLSPTLTPPSSTDSDNDALFSSGGSTIFITRGGTSASVWYYPINATSGAISGSGANVNTGTAGTSNPGALTFNFGPPSTSNSVTQSYIYAANSVDNTVIGFPINTNSTTGALSLGSSLANGPYSTLATTPYALGYDNSGTYVFALNQSGVPDLIEYTVDTTTATAGRLYVTASVNTSLGSSASGAIPGITMATTH